MKSGAGIFSENSVAVGDRQGGVSVEGWENKQNRQVNLELDRIASDIKDSYGMGRGKNGEFEDQGLGEIVDEEYQTPVGMGKNDLMTDMAEAADREFQVANKLLKNYGGIAVNKIAGRGADSVTDKKVVSELVEDMERWERNFEKTGDVVGFYDGFNEERRSYQKGEYAKRDSEVTE